jgi:hypothetical protein
MRNGITPVVPLRAAGVNVAMGLDDKTINDDEDAVVELRMMHKVHRLHTFDLSGPALSAYEVLEIATLNGARASGFADEVGAVQHPDVGNRPAAARSLSLGATWQAVKLLPCRPYRGAVWRTLSAAPPLPQRSGE